MVHNSCPRYGWWFCTAKCYCEREAQVPHFWNPPHRSLTCHNCQALRRVNNQRCSTHCRPGTHVAVRVDRSRSHVWSAREPPSRTSNQPRGWWTCQPPLYFGSFRRCSKIQKNRLTAIELTLFKGIDSHRNSIKFMQLRGSRKIRTILPGYNSNSNAAKFRGGEQPRLCWAHGAYLKVDLVEPWLFLCESFRDPSCRVKWLRGHVTCRKWKDRMVGHGPIINYWLISDLLEGRSHVCFWYVHMFYIMSCIGARKYMCFLKCTLLKTSMDPTKRLFQ